jgi:pimeloyl-ACP methyl ester carboxylesterase
MPRGARGGTLAGGIEEGGEDVVIASDGGGRGAAAGAAGTLARAEPPAPVSIPSGRAEVAGDLGMPPGARGLVVFAHGSGSSRLSRRNRRVAALLREAGVGTLLMDLLTEHEEAVDALTGEHRFDIPLLARRLTDAIDWAEADPRTAAVPVGLFGASTGAAAALVAAARRPGRVRAVVSRGGRPDLAGDALASVAAPTLLVVGGRDRHVIELNRIALARLGAGEMRLVPGAGHLFEEPGALEAVAAMAAEWFMRHLPTGERGSGDRWTRP